MPVTYSLELNTPLRRPWVRRNVEDTIMFEQILPDLYRIEVPLQGSPLGWVNAYVVKGPERNLIIDTGLNTNECREVMDASLASIDIDMRDTDFFITHYHADHYELAPLLAGDTSVVYMSQTDKEALEGWPGWEELFRLSGINGFPEQALRKAIKNHPARIFATIFPRHFRGVSDGDILQYGPYTFTVVLTPGHTPGHACLYDAGKEILISGDHVLFDITPNITCWHQNHNPLKQYFASLEKINCLQINAVLPGHRRLMPGCHERIRELKEHHWKRNEEILSVLSDGPKNGYQTASTINWDIDAESWEGFPIMQKFFATGEAIAHLRYLEVEGRTVSETKNGIILFSLK